MNIFYSPSMLKAARPISGLRKVQFG